MSKTVQIINKEMAKDKNKVEYAKLTVLERRDKKVTDDSGNTFIAKAAPKKTSFNAWASKPWQEEGSEEPDFGFDLQPGDRILGSIVTRKVEPYTILDEESGEVRQIDTYSCLVQGDTDDPAAFEAEVQRQFRANGRPIAGMEQKLEMAGQLSPEQEAVLEEE